MNGRRMAVCTVLVAGLGLGTQVAAGQDTPSRGPSSALGLYGFGARGGVDFEGDGQAVVSVTFDMGHLLTERLRLRPSGELGFLGGDNTYLAAFELLYRFLDDAETAVPYVGGGFGIWGREECAADDSCPGVWFQFALGFEISIRDRIAWMVEYHPADAFRRQRLLIGFTTRRGG